MRQDDFPEMGEHGIDPDAMPLPIGTEPRIVVCVRHHYAYAELTLPDGVRVASWHRPLVMALWRAGLPYTYEFGETIQSRLAVRSRFHNQPIGVPKLYPLAYSEG